MKWMNLHYLTTPTCLCKSDRSWSQCYPYSLALHHSLVFQHNALQFPYPSQNRSERSFLIDFASTGIWMHSQSNSPLHGKQVQRECQTYEGQEDLLSRNQVMHEYTEYFLGLCFDTSDHRDLGPKPPLLTCATNPSGSLLSQQTSFPSTGPLIRLISHRPLVCHVGENWGMRMIERSVSQWAVWIRAL